MSNRLLKALLLLFILPTPSGAVEQQYFFNTIDKEDGLSHNGTRCILRDSRGYIWIGTYLGLNRYDGIRIRSYYEDDFGIKGNYISALGEDKEGNIWIGTSGGAVIYDYRSDSFRIPKFADGCDEGFFVSSIACNSKGEVWMDTGRDYLLSYDGEYLTKHPIDTKAPFMRMAFDNNDRLIVCGNMAKIYTCSNGTFELIDLDVDNMLFCDDEIYGPVFSKKSNDTFFIASRNNGFFEVNLRDRAVKLLFGWEKDQKPTHPALEAERFIWVPTSSGLIRYDLLTHELFRIHYDSSKDYSIPEDYLICAAPDNLGGIWIGTSKSGVVYSNPKHPLFNKVFSMTDGKSLRRCMVRGFAESPDGSIWIATERNGLLKYTASSGELVNIDNPGLPLFLTDILADGDKLWIGTQKGIVLYTPRDGSVVRVQSEISSKSGNDARIESMYKAVDGSIYAGSTSGELVFNKSSRIFECIHARMEGVAEGHAEDSDGNLWIGTYSKGVYCLSQSRDSAVFRQDCPQYLTSSILSDDSGSVWIVGSGCGISHYNRTGDKFDYYSLKNVPSFPNGSFLSALQDKQGHLWISTTSGLVDFDPKTVTASTYHTMDGLLSDEFCKSSLKSSTGDFYFGNLDGFIVFDPEKISKKDVNVDITTLYIDNERVSPGDKGSPITTNINLADEIRLAPDQNNFTLEFATPLSSGSRKILCQLEGYDAEMRDVSSDLTISYFNLPAGTYTLKTSGHKNIKVLVKPHFLASVPGILILILSALTLMILASTRVIRIQTKKKNKKEEDQRRAREAEMIKEKMNFMSNVIHEIKTPLTLIKSPLQNLISTKAPDSVENRELEIIKNSTDYLDKLSKELLEFVKMEEVGYVLTTRPIDIVETLSGLCFNFSDTAKERNLRLEFTHTADQITVKADEKALSKILNNLIHNALKYASTYIKINAEEKGDQAVISFRNDGERIPQSKRQEIFKPFVQLKSDSNLFSQSFGIGLSIAKKLTELHGGQLALSDSDITEFLLSLPLTEARPQVSGSKIKEKIKGSDVPSVLVVEDNVELADFLVEKLYEENFNAMSVQSAEKALEIIPTTKVDLVLTDISMPGIGGIELCRRLNSGYGTSGIPVVIISAIASESAKINCMKNGACFYIEKPFTIDYLVASIRSILEKHSPVNEALQFDIQDKDTEFLRNLNTVVDKHIGDDSFTVKQLEDELFMSHSSLNRKMGSLLGTTSVDYIKTQRLKAAARILASKDINISEVGYKVGFSSPSYFSKCFREYFGKTPVEYAKEKNKD